MASPEIVEGSPRRRGRSGETRALLCEVCIQIVRTEGRAALSVQRVAKEAGISAPGFYNHFKNTEELLGEALGGVMADLARRQSIGAALERLGLKGGMPTPQVARQVLDSMLSVFLEEPELAELYIRYRTDPTMVDGAITEVAAQVLTETVDTIWGYAQRLGTPPKAYARVAIFAEHLIAHYYRAAEMLLSGRHERELVIETTTNAIYVLTMQLLKERQGSVDWTKI